MSDATLARDDILDAAEGVLRRYGSAKTTVVDVARALDVSHGSIYRHFPSKAALRDAVAERWLHRVSAPLAAIASDGDPAQVRLRRWFDRLVATKRRLVEQDPELFATYHALAEEARAVVEAHIVELVSQVTKILRAGIAEGAFTAADPERTATALFAATAKFHHPAHAAIWAGKDWLPDFDAVWELLMDGLRPR
jgi:AcrR family transcriptional regulator